MAVGIIIGGAFGKIVSSFVSDIIMPPIGLLIGGVDFKELVFTLKQATTNAAGNAVAPVTINIGTFIQTTVDFLIIAFAIFMLVKALNNLKKKADKVPATPPAPTKEESLLTEIRDILKEKK